MIVAHLPIALVLLSLPAPADVTVSPSRGDRALSYQKSLGALDRPSDRTVETLKRYALERIYRKDPAAAIATLDQQARVNPEPDLVFALAELSWVESKKHDRRRRPETTDRIIDVLSYAHDYLFGPELANARQPSDPRYRLACDLYNGALDRLLREAQVNGSRIEAGGEFSFKTKGREQVFKVVLRDSPWTPEDIDQIILASAFEVGGLPAINYQYGLGVPLIAVRRSDKNAEGTERFYPPEMAFPLTAFVTPPSKLREPPRGEASTELVIELIDPLRTRTVGASGMPIESDLTTPLAYMWSRSDLNKFRWTGLLRPGKAGRAGLLLIRPYEPGKIPVVMVHGLVSSPLAWVAMVNDLLLDPRIQDHFQFMLSMYPTGIPFPIAAAGLRETLQEARETLALMPDGQPDPAYSKMVLLGHSMGGLISQTMAVDSEEKFWELNTYIPFPQIKGPPEVLAELQRYMFFEAQPFVSRVVFLAVPHRGSDLTRALVGRVSSNLISADDHVSGLLNRLVRDNPDAFPRRFRKPPTSIETLDPESPYLKALLTMKPNPNVTFHSIIGSERPEGKENTTDGVVPYRSSHVDGVKSELIVQSNHGVQANPYAIMEVHRILLEHIGQTQQQVQAPPPTRAVE